MKIPSHLLTAAATALLFASSTASAADEKAGWSTALDVVVEGTANVRGGADRGRVLHGLALAKVEWTQAKNADRNVQWQTYASAMSIVGQGPTGKFIGDFQTVSNIEGHESSRLYSWWAQANVGDWSVRAGALLADEEFAGTAVGGNMLNAAFGWPTFLSANTLNTGPAFFVAAPGVRVERTFGEVASWRLGVYDGDAFDSVTGDTGPTRHGIHYRLGGRQGWFAMTEVAAQPADSAMRVKAGGWFHTAKFDDTRLDASGRPFADTGRDPRQHGNNLGAYGVVEYTLAGKSGEAGNVEAYVRAGTSPANRNMIGWAADAGISFTGLIPSRKDDVATIGIAHSQFSSRFAAHARATDPSSPTPNYEQTIEAGYRFAAFERFVFQPDVQFIRHPGGSTALRDALAFTLRVTASF